VHSDSSDLVRVSGLQEQVHRRPHCQRCQNRLSLLSRLSLNQTGLSRDLSLNFDPFPLLPFRLLCSFFCPTVTLPMTLQANLLSSAVSRSFQLAAQLRTDPFAAFRDSVATPEAVSPLFAPLQRSRADLSVKSIVGQGQVKPHFVVFAVVCCFVLFCFLVFFFFFEGSYSTFFSPYL
jgi:hypothetical protein